MIKRLKGKFILINMACVVSILLAVLAIFYFSSARRMERLSEIVLLQAIERDRMDLSHNRVIFGPRPRGDSTPFTPVFVVTLNQDHSIANIRENNITVTKELAQTLIELTEEKGLFHGVLEDYSLRYLKVKTPEGMKIAFADQSYELNSLKALLVNCLLVFSVAFILFLILSLFLSRLALKPVEVAWKQQNQFIADASHELKTPLTVILANLQILSSHKDQTIRDQEKWLDNTREEVRRMKQLVEELLFLARSDAKTVQADHTKKEPLDFSDTVLNGVLLFESIAFENKVNLKHDLEPDIPLEGCEDQLRQLVTILLDNGCKYAGKNGSVSVELKKASHHAVLKVQNTGELISAEEQKRIFERFYRTDKSRARKSGGYGLGLSIAKTIAEYHKGKISVSSSPETGTVFTVTLPLPS
ncbi:MAG: HAMP domain-containing sensor histidine kinase [Lacrimispora sp.]|uniref:sensor histidine kinase n=1 Tax=Lacrimispora sp. TaxID=2719234 RepID=UPI0039E6852F